MDVVARDHVTSRDEDGQQEAEEGHQQVQQQNQEGEFLVDVGAERKGIELVTKRK